MSRITLNIVLLVVLAIMIGLNVWSRREYINRNMDFIPGMVTSVAYNAYDANPNFPDGKTLRTPPVGCIARGFAPLHFAATPEDALRAGRELMNPISPDSAADLARGAVVYKNVCTPCHGGTGLGDGAVAKRGFPPPPSLAADHATAMPDGQMYHVITFGQGNMPSLAAQVSRRDRWCAILHIRVLQKKSAAVATIPKQKP